MRGLYAIVDTGALADAGARLGAALDPALFAEAVLDARPAAIQLRDKRGDARSTLELLRRIAPLAARAGVPFFANDRPDLAALAGCDGVHLGQDDVPASVARRVPVSRPLRIGLSSHDAGEVAAALAQAPDYLAIGPVFTTNSKDRPSPVIGLEGLSTLARAARAARPGMPTVAIGGITESTVAAAGAIADMVAVISALIPRAEPGGAARLVDGARDRARALHRSLCGEAASS